MKQEPISPLPFCPELEYDISDISTNSSIDIKEDPEENENFLKLESELKCERKPKSISGKNVYIKREKNRLAAQRCRNRQKNRIEILEQMVDYLSQDNNRKENEIKQLVEQIHDLERLLNKHNCVKELPRNVIVVDTKGMS